jgi:hypothetical protein
MSSTHSLSQNINEHRKIQSHSQEIPDRLDIRDDWSCVTKSSSSYLLKEADYSSNYRNLVTKFLDDHQLIVDIDGNFSKRDQTEKIKYKIILLNLMALMMIGFIAHIIRKIPYCPVTVIGTTFYSRIISLCMSKHNIPHIMCKCPNRTVYYNTENGYEIPFDGPSQYFSEESNRELIPIIPHSIDQLKNLETHTKLENLSDIQENILSGFPTKDGIHFYQSSDFVSNTDKMKNPVTMIKRCFGDLYYIITCTDVWLSRFIVSDIVATLQPNEIVSCLYGKRSCGSSTGYSGVLGKISPSLIPVDTIKEYDIQQSINKCIIREHEITTELFRYSGYYVNLDLTIKAVKDVGPEYNECLFYNLEHPRPFSQGPLYIVHPYHLPPTWDPFLSIMIVIYAIFKNLSMKSG